MSPIKIIYQDQDLIIIDKPAGMVANRADTVKNQETVEAWAEKQLKVQSAKLKVDEGSDFYKRAGVVHRLDKETSGVMIIAKNEESFKNLQLQFKKGRVEKVYLALCHGAIRPSEGEINVPIGRLPWNRMRFGVLAQGRQAKTLYKVLKYRKFNDGKKEEMLTLLEVLPATGRTHQIRVHMLYLGHPIFADELYAGRKNIRSDRKQLQRHFLHASKIIFNHPATAKSITFESPLPQDLTDLLSRTS